MGLYGLGFLYVSQNIADRLKPAYLSGQGVTPTSLYVSADTSPNIKPGAGRFEVGNPNHIGCVAAAVSIAQLLTLGAECIEQHVLDLSRMLSDGLKARQLPVLDPPANGRTHIVAIGGALEPSIDTTTDAGLLSLYNYLAERRVHMSIRRGVLRFSVHGYTSHDDVANTLDLVSEWHRSSSLAARAP